MRKPRFCPCLLRGRSALEFDPSTCEILESNGVGPNILHRGQAAPDPATGPTRWRLGIAEIETGKRAASGRSRLVLEHVAQSGAWRGRAHWRLSTLSVVPR